MKKNKKKKNKIKEIVIDFFSLRNNIDFLLVSFTGFNFLLIIYRVNYTDSIVYVFLIWNIFLAWIPYLCSLIIRFWEDSIKSKLSMYFILIAWLLFFPNALYILTDLFHLRVIDNMPLWFDLILILSFALNGLFLGFISLIYIQNFLEKTFSKKISWIAAISALFLGSFGIYVGRFLRWNSWDIISNPIQLLVDILERIFNPFEYPRAYGMTILFFVLLTFLYLIIKALRKSEK